MVIENPSNQAPRELVTNKYAEARQALPQVARSAAGFEVNGRAAMKLERDAVVGDLDKYTVLVQGDGVIYRINLFGGGVGGQVEPTPETEALFNRLVNSFKVLDTPQKPRAIPNLQALIPNLEPAIATVFTYPLRSGVSQGYGVPVGIVISGTRMEWLDYGIRNLDQWRTKCYGVDWSRAIHTGEDWYRDDYLTANTAGSPVYAVADGVVAQHNPGISYPGNVVLIRHKLANGRNLYSMYGHITNVRVVVGQQVVRGQQIATVLNQGYVGRTPAKHPSWDSHLHFEMRYIENAGNIYVPGTNAYGYNYPGCTYAYPGRGYTYIIHPDAYPYPNAGYTDPSDFIAANLEEPPPGCVPQELLSNGNFELGRTVWGAANSAGINDPLIYTTRPRTGRWSGWLGNRATYTDTLSQAISVPANSSTLRLTFWRYVQSKEAAGNADDKMILALRNPDGLPIATQEIATSATTRNVWQQVTVEFNLAGYAFSTATLSFIGINDGDLVSSFFVDDVSLAKICVAGRAVPMERLGTLNTMSEEGGVPSERLYGLRSTSEQTPTVFLPMVFVDLDDGTNQPEKDLVAPTCTNVLVNGDFESSLALPWSGIANTPGAIYNVIPGGANTSLKDTLTDASRAHSGLKSGRVGSPSVNGYWNELVQTVKLPANVTRVSLSYWRYLNTGTTTGFDRFEVSLESDKGIQLVPPHKFDNRSKLPNQWVQESLSLTNPAAYSGQSLWVTVKGSLDNTNPSSFLVDDVELTVCAQP
jgi:murein DD-endopeptidase MepM/ murein hydrolase activator NlpD